MVDQLASFAAEVTRVAREVGTEGNLGGQANVEGVSGVWQGLTDNVNTLAGALTTQLRAIAEVATAVTNGDLTREITVEARGEVEELRDNINQMITNLRETTEVNAQQDWLNTNLARFSGMLQGQRDLKQVSRLIMSELTPLVGAQHGAFFMAEAEARRASRSCGSIASYAYKRRKGVAERVRARRGARRPGRARAQADPAHEGARGLHHDRVRASARRRRSTSSSCRSCSRAR